MPFHHQGAVTGVFHGGSLIGDLVAISQGLFERETREPKWFMHGLFA